MDKTEADERTYSVLVGIDHFLGQLKSGTGVKEDNVKLKLANAIYWVKKNFDIDALDAFFQKHKENFKNLTSIRALIESRTDSGLHFDIIDRIIFYREASGDELLEIIRIEPDGMAYFKGAPLFRDKELYAMMAAVVE